MTKDSGKYSYTHPHAHTPTRIGQLGGVPDTDLVGPKTMEGRMALQNSKQAQKTDQETGARNAANLYP